MNNFIVSARKYRPTSFKSVVGQESITDTLKNSIKLNHLAHAYLFCGPRGVGKTTCARIFAKTINCQNITSEFEACNECESCKSFEKSNSFNIHELDAASNNSVDDIRNLIDQVRIPPQVGKYSIYIIDEVHMLSQQAFNAFLKTLEEPPEHAIFILATTEKHKIIPTILSRCQIFDFKRIKIKDITNHLKYVAQSESIKVDENALHIIAEKADGALRDALSIFDQIVSFSGNEITYSSVIENLNVLDYKTYFLLTDDFLQGNINQTLLKFDDILNQGFNITYFINGLSEHLRNILVSKDSITLDLLDVSDNQKDLYLEYSKKVSVKFILKALNILNQLDIEYKSSTNKRLFVEISLMKLCSIESNSNESEKKNIEIKQPEKIIKNKDDDKKTEPKTNIIQETKQDYKKNSEGTVNAKTDGPKSTEAPPDINISNISDITISKVPENKPVETIKVEENNDFTFEEFINSWKKLLKKYEARINAILENMKFDYDKKNIIINVSSENSKQEITSLKDDILKYLKTDLKNSNLNLEINLIKSDENKTSIPYTNPEKFKHLAKKNNALLDLKIRFDLEV